MKINAIAAPMAGKVVKADTTSMLKKELAPTMPKERIDYYIENLKGICNKLKISFNDLPINKEHPGNLPADKAQELSKEVFKICFLG